MAYIISVNRITANANPGMPEMTRISLTTEEARGLRNNLRAAERAVYEKRGVKAGRPTLAEIDWLADAANELLIYIEDAERRARPLAA